MKIDQRLNLIVPVEVGGVTVYAHSAPVSAETFDQYWLLLGKTYSALYSNGLGPLAGPRLAAKMMRDVSVGLESGPGYTGQGLGAAAVMNEVRRLTNVITPDGVISLQEAEAKKLIDPEDKDVLENAIVFFIVVSAMQLPGDLKETLETVCGLWSARLSSLNCTAFADSLKKSIEGENTGATKPNPKARAAASRVPA